MIIRHLKQLKHALLIVATALSVTAFAADESLPVMEKHTTWKLQKSEKDFFV